MDTWIHGMVRARCLRRVVAWGLAAACLLLLTLSQKRYISNFFMGPHELGAAELGSIVDVAQAPRYFARVTGSRAIDTGIQQITVRKRGGVETSRSVSAAYYALVIGDRLLLAKTSGGAPKTVEGELAAIPADLDRQLFDTADMQAVRKRFYPFYVSGDSFRSTGYWAIGGVLVFAFLFFKQALPAWRNLQDPANHPVLERVASWGDPIGIAVEAEREHRAPRYKGGEGWLVTDKYLLRSTFFSFDLLRLSDLLWAYKKVTKHSVNFIPTGKSYEAVLACYGGSATVKGNEKTVDQVLGFAAQRTPWAIFGFSKELETLFAKNAQDFGMAVEKRKREWAEQARVQPKA